MHVKLAEVTRGSWVEAIHMGSVVVMNAEGELLALAGDPATQKFFRSSAKLFQALPLIASGASDAFGFTTEELALSCASHNGTERHRTVVRSMLDKIGLGETDLRCGASEPLDEEEHARALLGLTETSTISCECSGEHAGMLAACVHAGWPTETYVEPEHPLQQQIRAIVAAACGLAEPDLEIATDGCSIPTFGAPIQAFAFAYSVLADPQGASWRGKGAWGEAALRLRDAVTRHPELVSGVGEIDTMIMQTTDGRVIGKLGAEGLLCLAVPEHRIGVAISDAGGSTRSLGPAAIAVLDQLGVEDDATLSALREDLCPPIEGFSGRVVGETRAALELQRL